MKLEPFEKALDECGFLQKFINVKVSFEGKPQEDVEILIEERLDLIGFIDWVAENLSECFPDLDMENKGLLDWLQFDAQIRIVLFLRKKRQQICINDRFQETLYLLFGLFRIFGWQNQHEVH